MQKTIWAGSLLAITVMSLDAAAVEPSLYMGAMGGVATNSGGHHLVQMEGPPVFEAPARPSATQFGTRIFLGGKFNRYVGLESGITFFSKIRYSTSAGNPCSSIDARVNDFDLVGVGSIPLGHNFTAFAKGGAALVYVTSSNAMNPVLTQTCGNSEYTTNVNPTFALGLSYDLNKSWVVDASWTRLQVESIVNHVDLFALGISFHFVDVYCGKWFCV